MQAYTHTHSVIKHIFIIGTYAIVVKGLDARDRSGFNFLPHHSLCLSISFLTCERDINTTSRSGTK